MSQQSWGGSAQGGGYGAADPWSTQQSQGYGQQQGYGGGGGGPMRSSSYAGGNRSAPYGKDSHPRVTCLTSKPSDGSSPNLSGSSSGFLQNQFFVPIIEYLTLKLHLLLF